MTDNFATYITLLSLLTGLNSFRRGHNGRTEPRQDLGNSVIARIDTTPRLANSLQPLDYRDFFFCVLKVHAD